MTVVQGQKNNFDALSKAFEEGRVALLDCIDNATGVHVAVICAVNVEEDESYSFVPFAKMFNGNPYEEVTSPTDEDYEDNVPC